MVFKTLPKSYRRILLFSERNITTTEPKKLKENTRSYSNYISNPLSCPDYFGLKSLVSVTDLFQARVHLGHRSVLRNDYMKPYIFGCRQGIDIIDLDQTCSLLFDALNFTAHIAYRQGIILFVYQNKQMLPLVERTAENVGEYSYCRKWEGGVFTNSSDVFHDSVRLPDLVLLLSTCNSISRPHSAVRDAAKMLIPTVGVVDTNADPRLISYPVPGNDDSPTAVRLFCALFAEAIARGKRSASRDQILKHQLSQQSESPESIGTVPSAVAS
ncbi:28S ribosomal protein S2 isoform 2 [Schistosoma japonicum]|uniref:Small ribosomal subunit protein uS2m n=2 Tax=Schistosoma japonicum TaxID=6182 RepID=C7TZB5_SCHJA|nr:28S ribosomal protein S2 isoform 2 [Schistosoma japonicum]TNN13246.1 28S ribosomal protein S2 isoform 2 [Schistosoma japonicum]CAX82941.1 Mitochondrial 28S ribosomal protein S2 [Schistosoma japonicum]